MSTIILIGFFRAVRAELTWTNPNMDTMPNKWNIRWGLAWHVLLPLSLCAGLRKAMGSKFPSLFSFLLRSKYSKEASVLFTDLLTMTERWRWCSFGCDHLVLGDGDSMMMEKMAVRFLMVFSMFVAATKSAKALEILVERDTRWCSRWSWTVRLRTLSSKSLLLLCLFFSQLGFYSLGLFFSRVLFRYYWVVRWTCGWVKLLDLWVRKGMRRWNG